MNNGGYSFQGSRKWVSTFSPRRSLFEREIVLEKEKFAEMGALNGSGLLEEFCKMWKLHCFVLPVTRAAFGADVISILLTGSLRFWAQL